MKDFLATLVHGKGAQEARNTTREYLQARILGSLQRAGAMTALAFHGGTALRFLYRIPRYSEDLDFALENAHADYDFRRCLRVVSSELTAEGYAPNVKLNEAKTVHSAFVKFGGLLRELGLSPHRDETLSVKIEVDTRPPSGATLQTTVVRRHVTLQLQHHDPASLLAGKLHAVLQRPFAKGRDLYDLLWYLSDPNWSPPNLTLLNNALAQTEWTGKRLTESNWATVVAQRVRQLDWRTLQADVRPFVERTHEVDLLTRENVLGVLRQRAR